MTKLDHIAELRAELENCILTKRERAQVQRELKRALAAQVDRVVHGAQPDDPDEKLAA